MNCAILEDRADATAEALTDIETVVRCRLRGHVRDFRIVPRPGGLILRGQTRTFYAKQLAQHAVMRATSLLILSNEIEVS